jgi:DNA-binding MarR family transcriptional regulator
MESQGLIERVQDEKDGRRFILSLTEKGQNMVFSVVDAWTKIQEETTEGFTENEKAILFRLLKKLENNLDRLNQ